MVIVNAIKSVEEALQNMDIQIEINIPEFNINIKQIETNLDNPKINIDFETNHDWNDDESNEKESSDNNNTVFLKSDVSFVQNVNVKERQD